MSCMTTDFQQLNLIVHGKSQYANKTNCFVGRSSTLVKFIFLRRPRKTSSGNLISSILKKKFKRKTNIWSEKYEYLTDGLNYLKLDPSSQATQGRTKEKNILYLFGLFVILNNLSNQCPLHWCANNCQAGGIWWSKPRSPRQRTVLQRTRYTVQIWSCPGN